MLVMESAQLMAAKRCDCVLVVNDNDHLSGIFTVCIRLQKKYGKSQGGHFLINIYH